MPNFKFCDLYLVTKAFDPLVSLKAHLNLPRLSLASAHVHCTWMRKKSLTVWPVHTSSKALIQFKTPHQSYTLKSLSPLIHPQSQARLEVLSTQLRKNPLFLFLSRLEFK
jgi:hypothetical protein